MAKILVIGNTKHDPLLFEQVEMPLLKGTEHHRVPGLRCRWCGWMVAGLVIGDANIPTHECTGPADGKITAF